MVIMKNLYLLLCVFVVFPSMAERMCEVSDKAVFSCEVGTKSISVCLGEDGSVSYLYGTKVDLEIKLDSPVLSTNMCIGGGVSRLRFTNGNYSYIVYDVMCNAEKVGLNQWRKSEYAGLYVLKGRKVIANKECTGFSEGIGGINSGAIPNVKREDFNHDVP